MVELLTRLRVEIPAVELHVAGDKIHDPPQEPEFHNRARGALEATAGLRWHGAVQRAHVAELLGSADVGLSLRHPSLDDSAELSTKVLEYGAAGRPVLLNSTPLHVSCSARTTRCSPARSKRPRDDSSERAPTAGPASRGRPAGRRRAEPAATRSTAVAAGLRAPPRPPPKTAAAARSPRLLVAGHNQSFAGPLLDRAAALGVEVREDPWTTHSENDEETGLRVARVGRHDPLRVVPGQRGLVQRRKRPEQRLIVRFHRMEVETHIRAKSTSSRSTDDLRRRHVLEAACEKFGWPADDPRLLVVPNGVDAAELGAESSPVSAFTLGMIGYVPGSSASTGRWTCSSACALVDNRYRLIVKGRGPWEYPGWRPRGRAPPTTALPPHRELPVPRPGRHLRALRRRHRRLPAAGQVDRLHERDRGPLGRAGRGDGLGRGPDRAREAGRPRAVRAVIGCTAIPRPRRGPSSSAARRKVSGPSGRGSALRRALGLVLSRPRSGPPAGLSA